MKAYFSDGHCDLDEPICRLYDVYRRGRSLFDPASGVAIELKLSDQLDNYIGTVRITMSLAEAERLSNRIRQPILAYIEATGEHPK